MVSKVTINGVEYAGEGDVSYDGGTLTIGGKPAQKAEAYKSTDDRRAVDAGPTESMTGSVAGGAFRSVYRPLTDDEKDLVDRLKLHGEGFYRLLQEAAGSDHFNLVTGDRYRHLRLSFHHMEDAVYRAVKHVTGPK